MNMTAMPEHVLLARSEFCATFEAAMLGEISRDDYRETLHQVFDVVLNGGREALLSQDFRMFPDLNRMRNTNWKSDYAFASKWRNMTRVLVVELTNYLDAMNLFGPSGEFNYDVPVFAGNAVTLTHFPY